MSPAVAAALAQDAIDLRERIAALTKAHDTLVDQLANARMCNSDVGTDGLRELIEMLTVDVREAA